MLESFYRIKLRSFYFIVRIIFFVLFLGIGPTFAQKTAGESDTSKLRYPIHDSPSINLKKQAGVNLSNPANIQRKVEFDPITRMYIISEKMGDRLYRPTQYLTIEEYQRYENQLLKKKNWKELSDLPLVQAREPGFIPPIVVNNKVFERIFGGTTIDIRPQVSAEVIMAGRINVNQNPLLQENQRSQFSFDLTQRMQANVVGQVGSRMRILMNYNTEAQFDFENQVKLQFTGIPTKPGFEGKDDDIIKKIEAGNTSFPLNTSLITGSQALFGLKTQLQFGKLNVTTVFSQQKSQQQNITISNGSQQNKFRISANSYDANRHFFLSQYFRDNYNQSLSKIPTIISQINVTRVEVWLTNKTGSTADSRDILALIDLGENNPNYIYNKTQVTGGPGYAQLPTGFTGSGVSSLQSNNLLDVLKNAAPNVRYENDNTIESFFKANGGADNYAKREYARKLKSTEYTINAQLGYVSLNSSLNADEVLAVAFQYTVNGVTYQVGEFSTDIPVNGVDAARTQLFVKLLKNETLNTTLPTWNLMMKNIYSLNAFQVNSSGFILNILRNDEKTGILKPQMSEGLNTAGKLWIQLTGLDNLNQQSAPTPDGLFDFIEGVTIDSQNGRIKFPVLEPFGSDLRARFSPSETGLIDKYVFKELYSETQADAQNKYPNHNRYTIQGTYQSKSGNEYVLNAINIPQGSVQISAGTIPLIEGVDFTVDYSAGRVRILNQAILSSGQPINIKLENSELFGIQQRTLIGSRFDYTVNKKLRLGATIINLTERPVTQKVGAGQEPIANTIWGLDVNYASKSRWLTRMVDRIPLVSTKAPSNVTFSAEYANLIPGTPRTGIGYLDDFEATRSVIDLKGFLPWQISGTPQKFVESANLSSSGSYSLSYGYNRARLAFYSIDPLFYISGSTTPPNIQNNNTELSNHYVRQVMVQEVFPFQQSSTGAPFPLSTLDLAFYPKIRGPYNYTTTNLNSDGTFADPQNRWGGMFRRIDSNDFDALNVEFIELWMLDPFIYKPGSLGGDLYLNIGNISEDILKDGRQSFENGLPINGDLSQVDQTIWGNVPKLPAVVQAFSNDPSARQYQDVGLDGLSDSDEKTKFADFLANAKVNGTLTVAAAEQLESDPSSDDFHYFRGSDLDVFNQVGAGILKRYELYNGTDGNSKTSQQSNAQTGIENTASASLPDAEDVNRDNNMTQADQYWEYKISIRPGDIKNIGTNYVANIVPASVQLANGVNKTVNWIQFKVPVAVATRNSDWSSSGPDFGKKAIGGIQDLRSIRFMRMFLTNFADTAVMRFAKLQLVRSEWRRYLSHVLYDPLIANPTDNSIFDAGTVSLEENGKSSPIPYVLPPGINRETDFNNVQFNTQLNEQSLAINVRNLDPGYARAVYKTSVADFRSYRRMQMFIHAEKNPLDLSGPTAINDNDVRAFIRFGSDNVDNYYEYEIPLKVTGGGTTDPYAIWPDANSMNVEIQAFQLAKIARNKATDPANGFPWAIDKPFTYPYQGNVITIKGQPDMSNVLMYMLGVRNANPVGTSAKSAVVWFNELRLTDPDLRGGWAAIGRLTAQLADLGNVTIAGNKSTAGFGSVNNRINERGRNSVEGVDLSSNIELGKFLPARSGVKIPMFVGYSKKVSTPQYDPRNPDLELKTVLANSSEKVQDSVLLRVQDYTTNASINFTNVRKVKTATNSKSHLWDVENLSASYAYTEYLHRDLIVENNLQKTYRASVAYAYSNQQKVFTPFTKWKLIKAKPLGLIRDFNFSLLPSSLSFNTTVDRLYSENKLRSDDPRNSINTFYNKNFQMVRTYGLTWNLTRSVQVDFRATNTSVIDEPPGSITSGVRDTIWQNLLKLGRTTNYTHNVNMSYNLPINKLPGLDWVTLGTRYSASFTWTGEPLVTANSPAGMNYGNTIQNTRAIQVNPTLNMNSFYNKFKFIRDIKDQKNGLSFVANVLTSLKSVSGAYIRTEGVFLPGYLPNTNLLGQNLVLASPGLDFAFGSQRDIRDDARAHGWITVNPLLSTPYNTTYKEDLNLRGIVEPISDLRIELNTTKSRSLNYATNFKYLADQSSLQSFSPMTTGNYSVSFFTLWTSLDSEEPITNASNTFNLFQYNRATISRRLGQTNPNSAGVGVDGYADGYSKNSQNVIAPAFIAAYTGRDADHVSLTSFPSFPIPNWRITYNGLTKIDLLGRLFSSIDINHAYNSIYSISNFNSLVNYQEMNGAVSARDVNNDFLPSYQFSAISIAERFAPLVGFNAHLKNNMTVSFEYRKNRGLSLSLANGQLTLQKDGALVFGFGYRTNKFRFPFGLFRQLKITNDLNFKFDFVVNDRKTIIYRTDVANAKISAGSKNIAINPSIDYVLNKQFNVRVFYTNNVTKPYTSQTFDTAFSTFGFAIKFNLQ